MRTLTAYALVALLTLVALGGVVRNGFVNYDDDLYLTANPELARGPGLDGLRWAFSTTRGGNWHPVTWISHLLDVRLFGLDPAAHHAVSLAIHTLNALVLLALLHALTGVLWPATFVAALFAAHPLHVESVAWAAERKDLLSTLFTLLAALAWVRGLRGGASRTAGRWSSAATTALFALALLAKPMPVTLPLLLLLLDWWPLGRWAPTRAAPRSATAASSGLLPPARLWREKAPLFALAFLVAAVTLAVQGAAGAMRAAEGVPWAARAVNALVSYALYLRKTVWPHDLAVFYPYPWGGQPLQAIVVSAAALAAVTAVAVHAARRRPWLPVGLLWYAVGLLPVIGLVQAGEQALADRYSYLPLVGVFIAAAWSGRALARRGPGAGRAVVTGALAATAALAILADRQVGAWRDGVALFTRAVAVTANNYIAHNNLGTALLIRGQAGEALAHFEATIRSAPASPKGYLNRGRALAQLGRHEEAVASYRQAIERDPADPLAQRNLALSLERLGRREEAIAAWREALARAPQDPRILDPLGVALARGGRVEEGVRLLEAAVQRAPEDATIRAHLAVARAQLAARPLSP